jgi:hypothetical protein
MNLRKLKLHNHFLSGNNLVKGTNGSNHGKKISANLSVSDIDGGSENRRKKRTQKTNCHE